MINRRKILWLISARLSYCPHCTYSYAGFVRWLRDRIIGSGIWPASSPDFNPYFFSWGNLKDKVYKSIIQMEELKENIYREIANISAEQLQRVKSEHLSSVRGMSICRWTAFSTPPVIYEQR
jgi:hypothetical protein